MIDLNYVDYSSHWLMFLVFTSTINIISYPFLNLVRLDLLGGVTGSNFKSSVRAMR